MKKIVSFLLLILLIVGTSIPCFAEEAFTPSATAKSAPELKPISKDDPNTLAIIYDTQADGTPFLDYDVVKKLIYTELTVTAYADRATASDKIHTDLEKAYAELKNSISLGDLCAELDQIAGSIDPTYTAENFVAADLFDLTLAQDVLDETHVLYVRLDSVTDFGGRAPVVIHRAEGVWKAIPTEKVVMLEDGSFTVEFDSLCPVALLKAVPSDDVVQDGQHCLPELFCHDLFGGKLCSCWIFLFFPILLILILIIICVLLACRKNRLKKELRKAKNKPSWSAVAVTGVSIFLAGTFVKSWLKREDGNSKKKKKK